MVVVGVGYFGVVDVVVGVGFVVDDDGLVEVVL